MLVGAAQYWDVQRIQKEIKSNPSKWAFRQINTNNSSTIFVGRFSILVLPVIGCRIQMEDAQERASTKRKRSEEDFEELKQHLVECDRKASALGLKIQQFTELLQLVTARDREDKPAEISWINHFESLLKTELPSCPEIFKQTDLSMPILLLEMGKYIGFLVKEQTKAKNALARAEKRQKQQEKKHEIQKLRLEKKAEKILSKDSAENIAAEAVKKRLCFATHEAFFLVYGTVTEMDLGPCIVLC